MKLSTLLLRAFCCGLFFLLAAFTAQAQTIYYVTLNGAGDLSGSSWANAAPGSQLQAKINGAASGSQIWVAAGTYKPTTGTDRTISFSMKDGVTIYGGFAGWETSITQRPRITYSHPSSSILSGEIGEESNGDNSYHVIANIANHGTFNAVLDGFVINEGNANGYDSQVEYSSGGGAIFNLEASSTIRNCSFLNNNGWAGGAIGIAFGSMNLENCVFSHNSSNTGGAIQADGGGTINVVNSTFNGNYADTYGAAIHTAFFTANFINCNFTDNSTLYPKKGVIYISIASTTNLFNCIMYGNSSLPINYEGGNGSVTYSDIDQDGFAGQNGNIRQDPLFTNAANGDLHLKPNSPVIDKGNNSANTTSVDLDGKTRIVNGTIDMGAYEFQCAPTIITGQPQNTSVCTGGTATFTVAATGPNFTYQWYKDGQAARSSNNSFTLTISKVTDADAGNYTVDIISDCGTVTSNAATLTVNTSPVVTVPANITTSSYESNCEVVVDFAATASGVPAPSITYKIGETHITAPYTFPVGTTTVTAVATNTCGTDTKTFTVTVQDKTAPAFTAPANQDIALGAGCSLTIPDLTSGLVGSDNCSNAVTFTQSPVAGTIVNFGHNQTQVVTITADDGHGNTTSHDVRLTAKDNTLPSITAPAALTVSADAGICSVSHVALGTPTTSDNCTVASVSNDAPTVFSKGATTVTWTAKDAAGNIATATQTITVSDKENPVINCSAAAITFCYDGSGTYSIPTLSATDNCGTTSTTYTITGATTRSGNSNDASGQFKKGTSMINWTVKDESGNTSNCQTTVVINAPVTVSVADVRVLNSGVDVNTVYVGYSPAATARLTAVVSGGTAPYTYKWSTAATTAFINVSPAVATTYTVTITDAKGCTGMATKQIMVINASCGKKVNVCHRGNTLCIDMTSVPDHLGHGDYLGGCRSTANVTMAIAGQPAKELSEAVEVLELKALPNPSSTYFTLQISGSQKTKMVLTITDMLGRVVETKTVTAGNIQIGNSYRPGVYLASVQQGEQRVTAKLIKQ